MISDDGKIKITDFGIAMALNSSQLTQTNSVMGSVHYLPPEQASGKGSTIKSDIYSMGIMLFELLTGKLPFKGENAVEIALKQMKDEIPSVRKINSNIPQSLENIILKATAKNPKNRYDDVKEMYNDLKVCLNEENLNQKPYEYKYPEHELDESDPMLQEVKDDEPKKEDKKKEKPVAKKIEEPTKEKHPISTAIIVFLLIIFIGGVGAIIYALLPTFTTTKSIKIPNVAGLTVVEAEKVLTNEGFVVVDETRKEYNDKQEKGLVIGTDPQVDRKRPKGTKITIIESLGKNQTYVIEDYKGKNYEVVQNELEKLYKMEVEVKTKEVEITGNIEEEKVKIIEQSIAPGTEIIVSEENPTKIILYVPLAYDGYPDFVAEGWSVEDIKAFAEKYEITVNVKEKETTDYPAGTVIEQNRAPKSKIYSRVSLTITIAKEPTKKEEPDTGSNSTSTETNTDSNTNTTQ
jgi:serine/threonine-protein kinase